MASYAASERAVRGDGSNSLAWLEKLKRNPRTTSLQSIGYGTRTVQLPEKTKARERVERGTKIRRCECMNFCMIREEEGWGACVLRQRREAVG